MRKKSFKILIIKEQQSYLEERKGYFTNILGIRMFIYHDIAHNKWRVTDILTGAYFASGNTYCEAKAQAIDLLPKFLKYKETKRYNDYRIMYNKLQEDN